MGYSNVQGDLNVLSSTSTQTLLVRGDTIHYGNITSTRGFATFGNVSVANLVVTGNFTITATNTQTTNALSINNAGTATALKVTQYEGGGPGHVHNVAEFWDFTTLAMVIDPEGNVGIHTGSSPGYSLSVVGGVSTDSVTAQLYSGNGSGLSNLQTTSLVGALAASQLQALQTNVTQVGTLTGLYSSGNITATFFSGGGNALSNVQSASLVGNVANANVALVVSQAAQPNITSVGLLSNLAVSNSVTTTNIFAITATVPGFTSQFTVNGGGTVTFSAAGYLLWSARVLVIPAWRNAAYATGGYWDIYCPTSGTIISNGGTVTCTAAGIPLIFGWFALYYRVVPGTGATSVQSNFLIKDYTDTTYSPDSNWILLAVRNGDSGEIKWMPGNTTIPLGGTFYTPSASYDKVQVAGTVVVDSARTGIFANLYSANALSTTNLFASNGLDVGPGTLGTNVVIFSNSSGGSNVLVMASNGYVGIGTTAPGYALDIGNPSGLSNKSTFLRLGNQYGGAAATAGIIISPWNGRTGGPSCQIIGVDDASSSAHLTFWTAPPGSGSTSLERVRIINNGFVGINTTAPTANLHVAGNIYASNALQTTNIFVSNGLGVGPGTLGTNVAIFSNSSGGSNVLVMASNGYVGIGTTNPGAQLDVYSTASASPGATVTNSGGSITINAGVNAIYFSTGGTVRGYYNAAGFSPNADLATNLGYAGGPRWNYVNAGTVNLNGGGANVYAANAVTTTNLRATTANVATLNVVTISNLNSLVLLNNLYAANSVTTTNLFANTLAASSITVTGNIYASNAVVTTNLVCAGFTSNASNTVFNFSTLTIPFVQCTTLNTASTANLMTINTTQILATTANLTTANTTQILATTANLTTANTTTILATTANLTTANVTTILATTANLTTANVTTILATTANLRTANTTQILATTANLTTANTITVLATTANLTTANTTQILATTANLTTANTTQILATTANLTTANTTTILATTANLTTANTTTILATTANLTTANVTTIFATTANTTTIFATTANLTTANTTTVLATTANLTTANATTIYAANSVTTANLVTAGITSNATNTIFNFDTLTIPFIYSTTLNIASTSNIGATVSTSLNVSGASNLSSLAVNGLLSSTNGSGIANLTAAAITGNVANANVALVVSQPAQPNITSLGPLTGLTVNGLLISTNGSGIANLTAAAITGNVANANVALVVSQPAQPNITSLGPLTGLTVNGLLSSTNGSGIANLTAAAITGNVANANVALVVSQPAQPNITSLGPLTGLTVNGLLSSTNGSGIANLTAAAITGNVANANVALVVSQPAQPNITSLGPLTGLTVNGLLISTNGSGIANLTAAAITGNVANSNVALVVSQPAQPNITSVGTLGSLVVSGTANVSTLNVASISTPGPVPASSGLFMNLNATYTLNSTANWTGNIAGEITSNLYTLFASNPTASWTTYGVNPTITGPTTNGGFKFSRLGPYVFTVVLCADNNIKTIALSSNTADVHSNLANPGVWLYCYRISVGQDPSVPVTIPFYVADTSRYYYIDFESTNKTDNIHKTAYTNVTAEGYTGSYVMLRPV